MNRFSQLQRAGQSYRPGGQRQEFATKLALGANLAENTKLTEIPLCPLWLLLNFLICSIRAICGSNPAILSNSFDFLRLCAYKALYLRAYKALHLSRLLYKSPHFLQNKPNFLRSQMNVSNIITTNYQKFIPLVGYKNKPNQTQFKPKTKPIFQKSKINVNIYYTREYNNKTAFRRGKNKPNQTQTNPIPCREIVHFLNPTLDTQERASEAHQFLSDSVDGWMALSDRIISPTRLSIFISLSRNFPLRLGPTSKEKIFPNLTAPT
jgi:hypothetical protein